MTINIIFTTMWASWIFLDWTLWSLDLSEGFFPPPSVSFSKKLFFFTAFQVIIQVAFVAKVSNFLPTCLHLNKVIICSHEIPPLWLFLIHYMQPQLSHVTTTKTTGEQGGGRGAKSALICLLFAETVHYWHCRLWQSHSREIWSQCNTSVPLLTHLS